MATEFHSFKRLVLGLQPSAPDRALQLAVELANLLQLDLLGLFLEDTSLHHLAGIPFAREFRPLGGGWHAIELNQLSREFELAARNSERTFSAAVKHLSTSCRFEVIRGPTATTIESVSRTGDIVMIVVPISPAERATQQFSWLTEAAFRSAAAVMLVPPHIVRSSGPIVAIAAAPDDPSIRTAASIAIALKEKLIIAGPDDSVAKDPRIQELANDTSLTIHHVTVGTMPLSDPARIALALRPFQERLIVMTRGILANKVAGSITSSRRIPVLVVEPSADAAGE